MKFGISLLPDVDPNPSEAARYFSMVLELSSMADDAGLDYVKMTEHYLQPYGGLCPSPLIFLASVAQRTKTIRLMTGCSLPVFHHPMQFASESALVDVLSGGRLDIGFARAYMPYEFAAFQVPLDESTERFTATVDAIVNCWSNEHVSAQSKFFAYDDVTTLPRPVQNPHPPVWVAAVRTPSSFEAAGRNGFGLLVTPSITQMATMAELIDVYRQSFVPSAGRQSPEVLASVPLYVADTDEDAYQVADPLLDRYLDVWAKSADAWNNNESSDYSGYSNMGRLLRQVDAKFLRTSGGAIVGSPTTVVERIQRMQQQLKVDGFLWQVDFGGISVDVAKASFQRYLDSVAPVLTTHDQLN